MSTTVPTDWLTPLASGIPWSASPASATPHQCTRNRSNGRRLPPAANPTHTAKPITMRTSITRGSLRLGRSLDQSFHGAWGESSG